MVEIIAGVLTNILLGADLVPGVPLLALTLLMPAVVQRQRLALPCVVVVIGAWVLGFAAFGDDWGLLPWRFPYRLVGDPVGSEPAWLLPFALALYFHARLERER